MCLLPVGGLAYFCLLRTEFCDALVRVWVTKPTAAHPEDLQTRLLQFLGSFDGLLGVISLVVIVCAALITFTFLLDLGRPGKLKLR